MQKAVFPESFLLTIRCHEILHLRTSLVFNTLADYTFKPLTTLGWTYYVASVGLRNLPIAQMYASAFATTRASVCTLLSDARQICFTELARF